MASIYSRRLSQTRNTPANRGPCGSPGGSGTALGSRHLVWQSRERLDGAHCALRCSQKQRGRRSAAPRPAPEHRAARASVLPRRKQNLGTHRSLAACDQARPGRSSSTWASLAAKVRAETPVPRAAQPPPAPSGPQGAGTTAAASPGTYENQMERVRCCPVPGEAVTLAWSGQAPCGKEPLSAGLNDTLKKPGCKRQGLPVDLLHAQHPLQRWRRAWSLLFSPTSERSSLVLLVGGMGRGGVSLSHFQH